MAKIRGKELFLKRGGKQGTLDLSFQVSFHRYTSEFATCKATSLRQLSEE